MTTTTNHPRRRTSRSTPPPGMTSAVRDELARLRGRILCNCAACGRTVYFEHNFTRLNGRVTHVRCPTPPPTTTAATVRTPRPAPGR